jgi:hypothetical protein
MCILRRLALEIEADQGARKADTCGKTRQSKETLCLTVCSKVRTGKKKIAQWVKGPCQGKQTNKPRAELEEEVHVISKKDLV